jgi:hypothetical protein
MRRRFADHLRTQVRKELQFDFSSHESRSGW